MLQVVKQAINEHNMLSASKIYRNIHLVELGALLDLSPEQAEQVASKMIEEKRLKATIDQIDNLIEFENSIFYIYIGNMNDD